MKGLFKKIAAAVLTVAMIASVGVVGFAVETATVTEGTIGGAGLEGKVNANAITMEEVKTEDIVTGFKFLVNHSFGANKEESNKTIGYTMLAYKGVFNSSGYAGDGSNIVGVAQQASATADFEFTVAKAATVGTDERGLTYGDTMVVLLSSDDAAGAVGYLYTVKGEATAAQYAGAVVDVTVPYNADDAAISEAVQDEVTGAIAVDLGNVVESEFVTLESNVTATIERVTDVANNVATVEIKETEGSCYRTNGVTTVSVPLNITEEEWTADAATYAETIPVDPAVTTVDEVITAVKDELAGKSVTLNDDEEGYTYDYALTEEDINAGSLVKVVEGEEQVAEDADVGENAEFVYIVTVPAGTYDDGLVTVPEGGLEAAITVKIEEDTRWAVESAELQNARDEKVETITIEYAAAPADKTALENAVAALVNGDTYKVVVNGKNAEEQDVTNVVTSVVTVVAVDEYTKPAADSTEDVAVTVTVTVPVSATFETADTTKITEAKSFDIEIVVKAAGPAWECGDVNRDGYVTAYDATAILSFRAGLDGFGYVETNETEADVNEDGYITAFDATAILSHRAGVEGFETLPYRP